MTTKLPPIPPLAAVVFDMDDTLYPESQFVRGGLAAAGAVLDAWLPRPVGAADVFLGVLGRTGPWHVFDTALEALGIPRDPALLSALVQAFRDHPPRLFPHSGVPELLDFLRSAGIRLGLVTDGYADVQRRKWAALGLASRFDAVVFTADVGGRAYPKPRIEPFAAVAGLLGAGQRPVLMVGDHPAKDFPPALALGWETLRVRHQGAYHAHDPDVRTGGPTVDSIMELAAVLRDRLAPSGAE